MLLNPVTKLNASIHIVGTKYTNKEKRTLLVQFIIRFFTSSGFLEMTDKAKSFIQTIIRISGKDTLKMVKSVPTIFKMGANSRQNVWIASIVMTIPPKKVYYLQYTFLTKVCQFFNCDVQNLLHWYKYHSKD